jgi:Putative bacterial sensory transduction regulator
MTDNLPMCAFSDEFRARIDDMSTPPRRIGLQPFDRDMIADCLERREMPFTKDSDGDFAVTMRLAADGSELGLDLALFFLAAGTNGEVYSIRGSAAAPVPEDFWGPMITTCNRWNAQSMYTKAYLITQEATEEQPALGQIVVDMNVSLEPGVSQMQIDEFTQHAVDGIVSFWGWLASEGIIQLAPPEGGEETGAPPTEMDPNLN